MYVVGLPSKAENSRKQLPALLQNTLLLMSLSTGATTRRSHRSLACRGVAASAPRRMLAVERNVRVTASRLNFMSWRLVCKDVIELR